ncbi:MAG: aminoacyl-tRNA hydrolase [Ardenticatenales bacterium]|nr:aminoacyl-tRNA hydrolase [Ardenticatenales bacterium]
MSDNSLDTLFSRLQPDALAAESTPQRALVVGLGNPGREYRQNRHNLGFMVIDKLAQARGIQVGKSRSQAIMGDGEIAGIPVILAKPQTYMNNSGAAVSQLLRFFKIPASRLLVIYDELDLPLGTLRLRQKGSAGGHNGMRSLIQHLGDDFPRLRLGIGRPPGRLPAAAFVLQNFAEAEQITVEIMLQEAVTAVETFLTQGIDIAMTRHNGPVAGRDADNG